MVAVVCAMKEEALALKHTLSNVVEKRDVSPFPLCKGELNGVSVSLIQSGIGKVNAALASATVIGEFKPSCLINIGVAGGLGEGLAIGDLIYSSVVAYNDVDVTTFNYPFGQLPGMPPNFDFSSHPLIHAARRVEKGIDTFHTREGLIVSGDSFIGEKSQYEAILKHYPDALAVEMEAAAIGHTGFLYNTPFLVIRAISDLPLQEGNEVDFNKFLHLASERSVLFLSKLIKELKGSLQL